MESDRTIPTASGTRAKCDATQAGPTLVTPVTPGAITSCATSRVSINIIEESVPDLPMDMEEEKELHADPHRPLQSIKK